MAGNGRPCFLTEKEKAMALEMFGRGMGGAEIARHLNVNNWVVYRVIRNAGSRPSENQKHPAPIKVDIDLVVQAYSEGKSIRQLAREIGISYQTARKRLMSSGVNIRDCFKDVPVDQIVRRYKSGESQEKIAESLGVSQAVISRRLIDCGIQTGRRFARGSSHGSWKGGRMVSGKYCRVLLDYSDPLRCMAGKDGYAMEHRVVLARSIGRALETHETVHHIDGDTMNNDISNLQLRSGKHGRGAKGACLACGSHNVKFIELE